MTDTPDAPNIPVNTPPQTPPVDDPNALALKDIDKIADQLAGAISGRFDFLVKAETSHPTSQKLAIMANFLMESVRSAISQRDSMAETLRGQEFLRQLIDVTPELVYTTDIAGRFTMVNKAMADFYGTQADRMIGKHPSDFPLVFNPEAEAISRRIINTGESEAIEELRTNAAGEKQWYRTNRAAVRDGSGKRTQILTVASNITDYKNASEELNRLISELQSALKFKDQFLATMSHELRTPLNAITGFTGIQLMTPGLPPATVMMLERIDFNAKRLANLINDVLDISRINAGRVEILWAPVDLREIANTWSVDYQQRMAAKSLEFKLNIDDKLPKTIISDPERLTQIANNLLTNALKFTEKGSITLSIQRSGEQWTLSVADTGIGIPATWQQTIFEEFRQVEDGIQSKYGGTGLGLAIVQRLCILMNGQIRLESTLGSGSTFTAYFPLETEKKSAADAV